MSKSNKKKIKNKKSEKFTISKFIFDKLYVAVLVVLIIMLVVFYKNNEVTNNKLLSSLKSTPANYSVTDAIEENKLVNYYGVITNLNLLYDFVDDCEKGKTSELTYVVCNDLNELIIKTALYKNDKIYVNVDSTRTSGENKGIKTFTFTDYELLDKDGNVSLVLSNRDDVMNFFEYIKK